MATSGAGSVAVGLTLIAFGCAALYYAVEGERAQGLTEGRKNTAPVVNATPCPSVPAPTATTATPVAIARPTAAASASAAPSASAPASSGDAHLVTFAAGAVTPAKAEMQRVIVYGAKLARFDNARITLEGFADDAGADDKTKLLARRRALIVRQALTEAGVAGEHVTVAPPVDVATEPSLAGHVRIKTVPPIPMEGDPQ